MLRRGLGGKEYEIGVMNIYPAHMDASVVFMYISCLVFETPLRMM